MISNLFLRYAKSTDALFIALLAIKELFNKATDSEIAYKNPPVLAKLFEMLQ